MRRQRMKGMDGVREGGRLRERQKERLQIEWMERMILQRYRKRVKQGNICRQLADCEDHWTYRAGNGQLQMNGE